MNNCRPTLSNRGGRNLYCSHYDHCLDYAIENEWNSWNCARCDYKDKIPVQTSLMPGYSENITYYEFGNGLSSIDLDSLPNSYFS